jgi:folate-binding protein YgfZ
MLTSLYKRSGIALSDAFGVTYPDFFVHPAVEYRALLDGAGVLDLTHWTVLSITGKDGVSFLNNMVTNDVASLDVDRGCHALLPTIKGKIVAELYVFTRVEDTLVLVPQGDASEVVAVLNKHIISEDVTVDDVSQRFGVLAFEGNSKKIEDVLWRLFEKGPFPKERYQAHAREFCGVELYMMRNTVVGDDGYHCLIPADALERLRNYFVQAARGSDGVPVGRLAWDMRRAENGLPWYDRDYSDNFPDEVRLGHAIDYEKGCYRGQETLARLHHRGHVNKVLVGFTPGGDMPEQVLAADDIFAAVGAPADEEEQCDGAEKAAGAVDLSTCYVPGTEIRNPGSEIRSPGADGKVVGEVRSAVYSPMLNAPLLLAFLRYELIENTPALVLADGTPLTPVDLPVTNT